MSDGIMISISDDGVAKIYDDTYDITIHCESEEEQDEVVKRLRAGRDFDEWCTDCKEYDHEKHCCPRWNRVIRQTLKDTQPKKGTWLTSDDMYETGVCSCCGYDTQEPVSYVITNFKHCPNCGAKMEGETDEIN